MDLGVAYYPEHWPPDRWATDARLMREAHLRRVRLAEFAWQSLEPREGRYDFEWLERAIRTLVAEGLEVILCTPTPAYPAWLHRKHPDIHQVKSNGQVKEFGQRQDACKNHPGYRSAARRIAERVLKRFGQERGVVAWQTDNELGCHGTVRCWCKHCETAFQRWLARRYHGDVRTLNRAWGTVFWSQGYGDFREISLPRDTADQTGMGGQNPGLLLDFHRFSSDTQVRFQKEQIDLIRRYSPGRLVTHNLMHYFYQVDYFDLAKDLDIVSWDNYPYHVAGTGRPPEPLPFSLMHGLKDSVVWVMEQASGPGGWGAFAATPRPGEMRLWAYQALARGADMVSFFRWRTARFGREQFWHGILHHHGQPQRRYEEVKRMGAELEGMSKKLELTRPAADLGLLFDFDSLWALEAHPQVAASPRPSSSGDSRESGDDPVRGESGGDPLVAPLPPQVSPATEPEVSYGYTEMSGQWLRVLAGMGLSGAVVGVHGDFARHRVLLAPTLHLVPPALAEKLEAWVRAGGTLILGPRSGVKDESSTVTDRLLPGALRGLAGVTVVDYDAFSARPGGPGRWTVRDSAGGEYAAFGIAEQLEPEDGARVVLTWGSSDPAYTGRPAAVSHRLGEGACIMVGTVLGDTGMASLFRAHLDCCRGREELPAGLEVVRRERPGGGGVTFYLNHTDRSLKVRPPTPAVDLLGTPGPCAELVLEPFGVAILEEP